MSTAIAVKTGVMGSSEPALVFSVVASLAHSREHSLSSILHVMPKPGEFLAPCSHILQFSQQDYMVNCVKSLFEVKEDNCYLP